MSLPANVKAVMRAQAYPTRGELVYRYDVGDDHVVDYRLIVWELSPGAIVTACNDLGHLLEWGVPDNAVPLSNIAVFQRAINNLPYELPLRDEGYALLCLFYGQAIFLFMDTYTNTLEFVLNTGTDTFDTTMDSQYSYFSPIILPNDEGYVEAYIPNDLDAVLSKLLHSRSTLYDFNSIASSMGVPWRLSNTLLGMVKRHRNNQRAWRGE